MIFSRLLLLLGVLLAAHAADACKTLREGYKFKDSSVLLLKKELKAYEKDLYIELNPLHALMYVTLVEVDVCSNSDPSAVEVHYDPATWSLRVHRVLGADESVELHLNIRVEYVGYPLWPSVGHGSIGVSDGVNY